MNLQELDEDLLEEAKQVISNHLSGFDVDLIQSLDQALEILQDFLPGYDVLIDAIRRNNHV